MLSLTVTLLFNNRNELRLPLLVRVLGLNTNFDVFSYMYSMMSELHVETQNKHND